ncbi:RNA polymerase sigma factor [Maritimibacter sp. DP07]|jgi:RNA polymerase sigma-70 factor (ECF subfamily)|uniref:RNA polymerase sigma factor n=1 Tax=Maritimibacter harenae TaxID=2606218 RepID=A0A845M228_9RHOB|nr:RNA polymerase sigma factor [Maritimibacter harenae]MZR13616.1 RNA polymerase sigma factor [Maritimibacter harenae]
MVNDNKGVDPREAVVEHLPAMRAFAASLTRNSAAADDLVQDTIVKAWKNFDKFQEGTNLRAWLFTILRNTFYSDLRKKKREVEDADGVMAETLSEKPHHDGRLALADFERVFSELPVEQREALILVGASGMSYEEAAETCGVAIGTIKSRINRGRAKLTELLELSEDESLELTDSATMAVVSNGVQPRKSGN